MMERYKENLFVLNRLHEIFNKKKKLGRGVKEWKRKRF